MEGKRLGVIVDVVCVERFQRLGDTGVDCYSPGQRQFVAESLLDDRVAELVLADRTGKFFDYPRRQTFVDDIEKSLSCGVFRNGVDFVQGELAANDRRGCQDLVCALGKLVETPTNDLADPFRRSYVPRLARCQLLRG